MAARKKTSPAQSDITPEIYTEQALWQCKNLQTGLKTRINGALAQVLKKYPADYQLVFIAAEGA